MGKLKEFEIFLSNQMGVYYAGQVVEGTVVADLSEPITLRGLYLRFDGGSTVHWTERRSSGKGRSHTVTYHNEEPYFSHQIVLFGKTHKDQDNLELPAGRHVYPFQFSLPAELPSSFEGVAGHVRYTIKVTMDRPWRFDHTCKRAYTVVSLLDLNAQPGAMEGAKDNKEKRLCCLCCKSGPISAMFHITRKGYVPGEAVHLYAELQNLSNRLMDKSYVDLRQVVSFHARTKTKRVVCLLGKVERPSILPGKSDQWHGEKLVIPPVPPSYLLGCNIIDIRYYIQMNVDPAGPAFDLEVPLEIIVGNIPLRQIVEQNPPLMSAPAAPAMPNSENLYGAAPSGAAPRPPLSMPSGLPPPCFTESVFGKVNVRDSGDDEHTRGASDYAPVYTYYNWGNESTFTATQPIEQ